MKNVVVIGAGYAGIAAVKRLQKNKNIKVTLIDKENFHEMKTEIHLIASGKVSKKHVVIELKDVINLNKVNFVKATVDLVDYEKNQVVLSNSDIISYDYLVIATGAKPNYFGNEANLLDYTQTFWNTEQALATWSNIKTLVETKDDVSISVIGAGATGIEFITDLVESLKSKYPQKKITYNLVAADARPLIMMDEKLSKKALSYIQKMGINTYFNSFVEKVDAELIYFKDETTLKTDLTVWLAGVQGCTAVNGDFTKIANRFVVNQYLQVQDQANVFSAGDSSFYINPKTNKPFAQMVEIAEFMGKTAAININNLLDQKSMISYTSDIHGTNVSLGKKRAVASIMGIKMTGFIARLSKNSINYYYYHSVGGIKLVIKKLFQ